MPRCSAFFHYAEEHYGVQNMALHIDKISDLWTCLSIFDKRGHPLYRACQTEKLVTSGKNSHSKLKTYLERHLVLSKCVDFGGRCQLFVKTARTN